MVKNRVICLLLSWGSTYGAARTAFEKLDAEGMNVLLRAPEISSSIP
jgi:hypothetical protein